MLKDGSGQYEAWGNKCRVKKNRTYIVGREVEEADFSRTLDLMNGGRREALVTEVSNMAQQARRATCLLSGSQRGVRADSRLCKGGRRAAEGAGRAPRRACLGDQSARPLGRVGPPHLVRGGRWRCRLVSGAGPAAWLPLRSAGRQPRPRDQPSPALPPHLLGAAGPSIPRSQRVMPAVPAPRWLALAAVRRPMAARLHDGPAQRGAPRRGQARLPSCCASCPGGERMLKRSPRPAYLLISVSLLWTFASVGWSSEDGVRLSRPCNRGVGRGSEWMNSSEPDLEALSF